MLSVGDTVHIERPDYRNYSHNANRQRQVTCAQQIVSVGRVYYTVRMGNHDIKINKETLRSNDTNYPYIMWPSLDAFNESCEKDRIEQEVKEAIRLGNVSKHSLEELSELLEVMKRIGFGQN